MIEQSKTQNSKHHKKTVLEKTHVFNRDLCVKVRAHRFANNHVQGESTRGSNLIVQSTFLYHVIHKVSVSAHGGHCDEYYNEWVQVEPP
jgi:hypothetical protein